MNATHGLSSAQLHPAGKHTIARLIAEGWIEKQMDASGVRYRITPAGEAALQAKIPTPPRIRRRESNKPGPGSIFRDVRFSTFATKSPQQRTCRDRTGMSVARPLEKPPSEAALLSKYRAALVWMGILQPSRAFTLRGPRGRPATRLSDDLRCYWRPLHTRSPTQAARL